MAGVELIVAALAAGASAGVTNTATSAVQETYAGLKKLLVRRFANAPDARQAMQADETRPEVWETRIGSDLDMSGATDDEQILGLARHLLALAGSPSEAKYQVDAATAKGLQIGDHNTQSNNFT